MSSLAALPPALPTEVLFSILQHLPRCDLKYVRLVSKAMNALSEPRLFRTILLVPHMGFLESFISVMSTSPVMRHVHKVIYDAKWNMVLVYLQRCLKGRPAFATNRDRERAFRILAEEVTGSFGFSCDTAAEVVLLQKIFNTMPNLNQIDTNEQKKEDLIPDGSWPVYFSQIRSNAKIQPEIELRLAPGYSPVVGTHSTTAVLLALTTAGARVDDIAAKNLSWSRFVTQREGQGRRICKLWAQYKYVLPKLQKLTLSFNSVRSTLQAPTGIRAFAELIATATELRSFRLKMTRDGQDRSVQETPEYSLLRHWVEHIDNSARTQAVFPHLQTLSLESILCTERELIKLLDLHSSTLHHLELGNILLVRHPGDNAQPCWVRVLKAIKAMRLEFVSFDGVLSNGGRQYWEIWNRERVEWEQYDHSLKHAVESWIVGPTPAANIPTELERAAIKHSDENDAEPADPGLETAGDPTWDMSLDVYNLSEDDNGEDWGGGSWLDSESDLDDDLYGYPYNDPYDDPDDDYLDAEPHEGYFPEELEYQFGFDH